MNKVIVGWHALSSEGRDESGSHALRCSGRATLNDQPISSPNVNEVIDAYCTLGTERDTRLTAGELLQLMDEAGIQRAVIAPEDREIVAHNASGNSRMAQASGNRRAGSFRPVR